MGYPFVLVPVWVPPNWQPVDPVVGDPADKITTRYEYWEALSPPSVYFNREFPYIFVPKTSSGGQILGSICRKAEGEKKN